MAKLHYRLALDLGSTSLGWAVLQLKAFEDEWRPNAIIKAGVRIFSDGRNPKDGSSLAVTRRMARAMRRRRDRLLMRKKYMMALLIKHGFFPEDEKARKMLERLNPYQLRAEGLDRALAPDEFGRVLFHINQRRGFKSNRKTDKKENDASALKAAIHSIQQQIDPGGADGKARTVGELLWRRVKSGEGVRARYRERKIQKEDGKTRTDKSYDLYIDRAMVEAEFDALWQTQAQFDPGLYNDQARDAIKDCLLHQRPLKPVKPGRCTLEADEERAPLALPSQQRFRIYQEVNNLRILGPNLSEQPLSLAQRDIIFEALERNSRQTFNRIIKALKLPGTTQFNLEDAKRKELKGNSTSAILGKKEHFGAQWFNWSLTHQDEIVMRLLTEESLGAVIKWLQADFGLDEFRAETIANLSLPEGYGSLSAKALSRILPELQKEVITYDKAVLAAGYQHHSRLRTHGEIPGKTFDTGHEHINRATGEVERLHAHLELPYYGEYLQRHVGFGTKDPQDPPEKRFGKIANPTVHIGLNQVRVVVNALIKRYGHPTEVIIEVARNLKQNRKQRQEDQGRQADNQKRNDRLREQAANILQIPPENVKHADIQKLILWEELSHDVAERRCPYSGTQIGIAMALSAETEIEHILPFSQSLDDSLNNKTLAIRKANRIKGNRTPWQAREDFEKEGWSYEGILQRAEAMPKNKRYRFAKDGYEKWLRDDKDFLARALNDTRYLSRVAREYLSLICPQNTRVIPGQMTAMLRAKFGLNDILGLDGEKNRNDHRHHAVDACVIAVTDQGMLQRFAKASASTHERQLDRLVESMPLPWDSYREHVARAVHNIWVSHKPDHGHEACFVEETAYKPPHLDSKGKWRTRGIGGNKPNERAADAPMIAISDPGQKTRHKGNLPYKGYMGGSNYCMEITQDDESKWEGNVISTFDAYKIANKNGKSQLFNRTTGQNGKKLIMRLIANDCVAITKDEKRIILRVVKMRADRNQVTLVDISEANHVDRLKNKESGLIFLGDQSAASLRRLQTRSVSISPIGELRDPGFKE